MDFRESSASFPKEMPSLVGTKTEKSPSENWTLRIFPFRALKLFVSVSQPRTLAAESFSYAVSISSARRATNIFTL
ncbi:MAG: hypothetical protein WKF71_00345 [Pyrinomonadaceae bacterium]